MLHDQLLDHYNRVAIAAIARVLQDEHGKPVDTIELTRLAYPSNGWPRPR